MIESGNGGEVNKGNIFKIVSVKVLTLTFHHKSLLYPSATLFFTRHVIKGIERCSIH